MTVNTALVVRPSAEGDGRGAEEFLVIKRPTDGLLGGLWEFPTVDADTDGDLEGLDAYLGQRLGLSSAKRCEPTSLGEFVHHFSHIRMTLKVELRRLAERNQSVEPAKGFDQPFQWVGTDAIESLAMSTAMRKAFALYTPG